ncbi:hypothetical protein MKEN_00840600 [Mycena kentingensis (nom. inval.)]|nr:hypothetical protein MKEN_00840600 [Mycena kentingensis (nom. inval.)]
METYFKCGECGAPTAQQPPLPAQRLLLDNNISLLGSNSPPDDALLASLNASAAATDAQLALLDAQIAYFACRIQALQGRRRQLEELQDAHRAVLSPLRRVPMEVLAHIFALAVGPQVGGEMSAADGRGIARAGRAWVLTHVCRAWRAAAVGTPTLWNAFSASRGYEGGFLPVEMLRVQMERAPAPTPLRMSFAAIPAVEAVSLRERDTLEMLVSRAEDWEELCARPTPLVVSVLARERERLRSLKRLWLMAWPSTGNVLNDNGWDVFAHLPALVDAGAEGDCTSFALSEGLAPFLPMANLTRYDIRCSWATHTALLVHAQERLVEARILLPVGSAHTSWPTEWDPDRLPDALVLRFRSLERLHVDQSEMLGCMESPTLVNLSLALESYTSGRKTAESRLLRSCCDSLQVLHFSGQFAAMAIPEMLRRIPSLSELRISLTAALFSPDALHTVIAQMAQGLARHLRAVYLIGMPRSDVHQFYPDFARMVATRRDGALKVAGFCNADGITRIPAPEEVLAAGIGFFSRDVDHPILDATLTDEQKGLAVVSCDELDTLRRGSQALDPPHSSIPLSDMQSPLLHHHVSSVRDSPLCDAPAYHPYPGPDIRHRGVHPLSTTFGSDNGTFVNSTVLDISGLAAYPDDPRQQMPLSKSEQDLALYLATSNLPENGGGGDVALRREATLLQTQSAGGDWSIHSIGSMFERGVPQQQSWGTILPPLDSSVGSGSSTVASPAEHLPKPYTPHSEYLPLPVPAPGRHSSRSWSPSSGSLSNPALSRRGSVSYHSPGIPPHSRRGSVSYQSPSLPPLPQPLPPSLLRVNVNTSPRIPISPLMQPEVLSETTDPSFDDLELEMLYPGMEEEERYVNLSDLHPEQMANGRRMFLRTPGNGGASASAAVPRGKKRAAEEDVSDAVVKRPRQDENKGNVIAQAAEEGILSGGEEEEEDEEEAEDEDEDTDDGEFVPGRSTTAARRTTRRRASKRDGEDEYQPGRKTKVGKRTGSAAAALKALTQLASGGREPIQSVSAPPRTRAAVEEGFFPPLSSALDEQFFPALDAYGPSSPRPTRSASTAGNGTTWWPRASARAPPSTNNTVELPVPVPNLTKKSRGRRVPSGGEADAERSFVCSVDGCGKCFVRGEHLKRHVRSIHTYEKPFACPYKGCGKSFSRRDNLAQHSRIHLEPF